MSEPISTTLPHPPPPARADVADTQIAANLAGLQRAYQSAVNNGESSGSLSALAKQITDAAKALGLSADLPRSNPPATAATPAPPPPPALTSSKVDVHA